MKINIESMVDTQRLVLMSQGEVFIWHIEQHLSRGDKGSKDITKGEVGCKICGKSTQEIFNNERELYYKDMSKRFGDEENVRRKPRI